MTGAPIRRSTPRTVAVEPRSVIRAPMRLSSGTCMNRFSKMVSVITDAPSAVDISAIIWA